MTKQIIKLRPMSERPECLRYIFLFSKLHARTLILFEEKDFDIYRNCLSSICENRWSDYSYSTGWLYADETLFEITDDSKEAVMKIGAIKLGERIMDHIIDNSKNKCTRCGSTDIRKLNIPSSAHKDYWRCNVCTWPFKLLKTNNES